jgi:hypothetical protein
MVEQVAQARRVMPLSFHTAACWHLVVEQAMLTAVAF